MRVVERRLQYSIIIVGNFAKTNGFKLSTSKTFILHFIELSMPPPIEIGICNIIIQTSETVKYLGLVFDSKIDWKAHIQQHKSKFNKARNLMRSVSSTKWGTNQKTLMILHGSLIRSKLDYWFIINISASSRELESLESVLN